MAALVTSCSYDTSNAVNVSSIPEEFLCPVCTNVVEKPVETACHHVFCKKCLSQAVERMPVCPCCRANVKGDSVSALQPVLFRMYSRIQMKCAMHCKGCDWKGNITDMEEHLNDNCAHNVAAISKKRKDAEEKAKQLEAKVQTLQEELVVQRALTAEALAMRSVKVQFEGKYSFDNVYSVQSLSNRVSLCANECHSTGITYSPSGGWKAVYDAVKSVHADWVRNYSNEPKGFHFYYGLLLSTCYLSVSGAFHDSQRNNIWKWRCSYLSWTQNQEYEKRE